MATVSNFTQKSKCVGKNILKWKGKKITASPKVVWSFPDYMGSVR